MASVVCKDTNEIFYILFGNPHDNVYQSSRFDLESSVRKNGKGKYIDTRILDLEYYDGWKDNEHHITTKSWNGILLPFFSYILRTFDFSTDDFTVLPYFSNEFEYDVSYLKPKRDMRFTMEINGVKVGEHLTFDGIQNINQHCDTEAFAAFKEENMPVYSEYHRLYRGSHACSRVINETVDNDLKIFISGDSMMIPAIPIFCCYYKEVVYMDNRDGKSHKEYYEDKQFDEILLCFFERQASNKVLGINLQ